ncbi:MAG: M24 family metallopeptidase [Verrucomicrobiota bacterium]
MKKSEKESTARLIIASSEQSADLRHATRFSVPDPIIWVEFGGTSYAILNALEIDRARKTARVDDCRDQSEIEVKLRSSSKGVIGHKEVATYFLKENEIRDVEVPPDFPLVCADYLRKNGILVTVKSPFFPKRMRKTDHEIKWITKGQRQAEAGLRRGIEIIKASSVGRGRHLRWGEVRLTSERLRFEIDNAVRQAGGVPAHTIVACGKQSCDPHDMGSGPLKAEETIILDIFPHDAESGYFGDLTRTVVKGKASEAQRRLYQTVKEAQRLAIRSIRSGVDGKKLQDSIREDFKMKGYPTEKQKGRWVGFFHGLGHGVGLEIHEAPRIASGKLKSRQVVTVEPGLYYPGIGGIRLEDLVVVETSGCKNLTRAPFRFEIP